MVLSIYVMVIELSDWVKISPADVAKALASNITVENNEDFARLVNDWEDGRYDEDPEVLVSEILSLL
jgi:hypothetical protein